MATRVSGPVADAFFSAENVAVINRAMVRVVFERSGRRIATQSQTELGIIMRSVYLTHAAYADDRVADQVRALNLAVLEYCVNTILTEVDMHDHYMRDRDQRRREVPPHAVATSAAGAREERKAATRDWIAPTEAR